MLLQSAMNDVINTSRENALKILEEYYKVAKEQMSAWDFFLNTAEYVRFVQNNSQLTEAVKKLEERHKQAYEAFQKIDNRAIRELENATKTITETIKRANINLEPVNNVLRELQAYNAGGILRSMSKVHKLDEYLFNIARTLKASGFENAIQQFIDNQKKAQNIYGNFIFSPTLPLRDDAEEELKIKQKTEIWGAWEDLPFVSRIFFDEINLTEELKSISHKNKLKRWELMNYLGVRGEFKQMRTQQKSENELIFFKVSDFRNKLDRIHNYFITELLSDKENKPQRLDFDPKTSTLYFTGEAITISKRAENDAHELLKTIFKDKVKIWNSDEILEDWQVSHTKSLIPKNKVYQAGKAVNRVVAQETKIKDFLIVSTKTVAINKKYLNG